MVLIAFALALAFGAAARPRRRPATAHAARRARAAHGAHLGRVDGVAVVIEVAGRLEGRVGGAGGGDALEAREP